MPGRKGFGSQPESEPLRVAAGLSREDLKIGIVEAVSERTLIFYFDMVFLRRFERHDLLVGGKVGLLDVDFVNDDCRRWTGAACRLLGLSDEM